MERAEKIRILKECGYNVESNLVICSDETPLMVACHYFQSASSIEAILQWDHTDVNAKNSEQQTALMLAACCSSVECINALLKSPHIDVNAEDCLGHSALYYASRCVLQKNVLALLECEDIQVEPVAWELLRRDLQVGYCVRPIIDKLFVQLANDKIFLLRLSLKHLLNGQLDKLNELIAKSKRLTTVTSDMWTPLQKGMTTNYSVILVNAASPPWIDRIVHRNCVSRQQCFQTAIFTAVCLRRLLSRDIANLIATLVWETRGTKVWVRREKKKRKLV